MSSTLKHLRSSTASKRPTASGLADGQIGINTASGTPALFFKDSNGGVVKVGPAHVGSTAPNAVPAGSAGNSLGELWVNDGTTIPGLNYYTGSAFVNLTPSGTTAVAGLVELATDAETQTGTDTVRAVTPSGLQSKISDSTSTTSSTTIASATAVKAAYDLADAALPKAGGRVTGDLEIGPTGSLSFEGSSDDSFETTLAVVNPTADRTITFPNVTGTVVTTGDSGTVTSTMILDGTIVNADINASAGIVDTKLATIATAGKVSNSATTATSTNTNSAIVARDGSGNFSATTITAALSGNASTATALSTARTFALTGNVTGSVSSDLTSGASIAATIASGVVTSAMIVDGTIVNADVNASAAIAGTKISPDFGSQNIATTGLFNHALGTAGAPTITFTGDPNTGIYSPGADQLAISTNGVQRINIEADGDINIDSGGVFYDATNNRLAIGTTSPIARLDVSAGTLAGALIGGGDVNTSTGARTDATRKYFAMGSFPYTNANRPTAVLVADNQATTNSLYIGGNQAQLNAATDITFFTAADNDTATGSERARIDSSGRLLVGTSTARANFFNATSTSPLQVEGLTSNTASVSIVANANIQGNVPCLVLGKTRGTAVGSNTVVQANDLIGRVTFQGSDGTEFVEAALIEAQVDGTPGANDMPGRLVFSVTADGASSPTEALRISNNRAITVSDGGNVVLGTTTGTKIGTATTQKLGFYNATPVVQPTAVANATDAASVITQLNALLTRMRNLGLIAT
jgi:hypothetical protein